MTGEEYAEKMKKLENAQEAKERFGVFVIDVLLSVPSMVLRGLVLSDLWAWFVVPLGAPGISKAHAIGLHLVVRLCVATLNARTLREDRAERKLWDPIKMTFAHAILVLIAWGIGAILSCWM